MRIIIKATNFALRPDLEGFIEEKISGLEKFIRVKPARVFVEIGRTTRHHSKGPFLRAECQIVLPGKKSLRAESENKNLKSAVVKVKKEMERQLKAYKELQ